MTPLVQAREQVLRAALAVLGTERDLADDEAATGKLIEAEHELDRAACNLADTLDTLGRTA